MVHLNNKYKNGFALLMSLIVVSVVISIGLVVLDLTLKQLRLSTNSKDSETAFHAANAAMECARYWRNEKNDDFVVEGELLNVECFGVTIGQVTPTQEAVDFYGKAAKYTFEASWGNGTSERCSQIDILVINSEIDQETVVNDISIIIPGFPEDVKTCEPGGRCTIIAARGYSRSCGSDLTLPGTVEREVLLEL